MNKPGIAKVRIAKVILNILIVIAALVCLAMLAEMMGSFKYANREVEDPAETGMMVFEYELEHRAYGEIVESWYVDRMSSMEAPAGLEPTYLVAEYAHTAFMSRVYEETGDEEAMAANSARREDLRNSLGHYRCTADEVDEMIINAP